MALKVFSNVGILCLEYPRKKDTVYSVEQLQSAGAEIRQTLAKQGYALLFDYANPQKLEISVGRKSDRVTWLIARYDASEHGVDNTEGETKFDRSLGWLFLVSQKCFDTLGRPLEYGGYSFIEPNTSEYCELPMFVGNSDAAKLSQLVRDSLRIEATYSALISGIDFNLQIDREQATLIQTLATNLNADWNRLAKTLASVCLKKFQEMRNALEKTPARGIFKAPSIAISAAFGIHGSDGYDMALERLRPNSLGFAQQQYKEWFSAFLEETILDWAKNVFSPKDNS